MGLLSMAPIVSRERWPHLEEVREILAADPSDAGAMRRLGASAAPTMWGVLAGEVQIEGDYDRRAATESFRSSLAAWSETRVVAELRDAVRGDTSLASRLVLVEMLTWNNGDDALAAVVEVLSEVDPNQLASHRVTGVLNRCLPPLLEKDPRRFHELRALLPSLSPPLVGAIVEAVAESRHRDAVLVFDEAAGLDPAARRAALSGLVHRGRPWSREEAEACREIARAGLDSHDPRHRRLAVQALEQLRDVDAWPELVASLDDADAVVQRVALRALQAVSGRHRRWSSEQWRGWWEEEAAWLQRASSFAADLEGGDAHHLGMVLHEIAAHPLFGEEVAALLARGLAHPRPRARLRVCEALARTGHFAAIPFLIEALDDEDPTVEEGARAGLRRLTGTDAGDDPRAWDLWWSERR